MKQVKTVAEFRAYARSLGDKNIGFVPTMGALHSGHEALLQRSVAENDVTVLSIYVNPTQFNNPDDLARYPARLEADVAVAESAGTNIVFRPEYEDMYPDEYRYLVDETALSKQLCGAHRPGHFTGVLTVVMKLLNIVRPNKAYFGEKDFQQLSLIRGMAEAFFLDSEIVGVPTVRESDGLALSSRNLNLSACDRKLAPEFNRVLRSELDDQGAAAELAGLGFEVDYIETIDGRRFGAASLGAVRLIDNVAVQE